MEDYWPLWKPLRIGGPTNCKLEVLVLPPLLQFWRCAPKGDVQAQDQGGDAWWLGGCWESKLVARKCYKDLELLPIPTHRLEGHQRRLGWDCLCLPIDQSQLGRDCLCLPIGRIQVMIRFLSYSLADSLGGFIKGFCDGIFTGRAPVTIRSWLTRMVHYKPVQIKINAPGLVEVFIDLVVRYSPPRPPRLNCTSRLSCNLKVLVFFVLLSGVKQTTILSLSSTGLRRCYATSRCRYRLMHPGFPTRLSATETQSSPPSSGSPGTTFAVTTRASSTRTSNKNLMTAAEKTFSTGLTANPFPPDLWGYVHGFGYQTEGSIAPLAHYNPLKIWQISFRRT